MDQNFTLKVYRHLFPLMLLLVSCSARTEQETEKKVVKQEAVIPKEAKPITVAAIAKTADEVYFDLIAETDECLGENLWLGGKLESSDKVVLRDTGAFAKTKVFTVTELTATGLSSNNPYQVNNSNLLKAKYDNKGTIYLQLNGGQIQLQPNADADPIVVAYQPDPEDSYLDGSLSSWRCQ